MLDAEGEIILSRRVEATEEALEEFCAEIAELGVTDERVVGIDLVGGPAALLEALLLRRGEKVRYLPGTAVNKAREAYAGSNQEGPPLRREPGRKACSRSQARRSPPEPLA